MARTVNGGLFFLVLVQLFVLLEYSSSFHTSTRVLASKKQIFVTLSLHMIFKTHYFFYTRVLGLRILTRVLLEYSSTNTSFFKNN